MELHRSVNNKMIAGVCGGLAESLQVNPVVLRIAFLVSILLGGAGILIYIALWIIMPQRDYSVVFENKFFRPLQQRMLGGVCIAFANVIKIDVSLIRLACILISLYFGTGILIYIFLWIAIPSEVKNNNF